MKHKLLILGLLLILFGMINIFWYLPISIGVTLANHPFPFQYLERVTDNGHTTEIIYLPINAE